MRTITSLWRHGCCLCAAAMLLSGCSASSQAEESAAPSMDTPMQLALPDTFEQGYADCMQKYFTALEQRDYAAYQATVYPPYQEQYDAFLAAHGDSDAKTEFESLCAQFDEDGYESWHFTRLVLNYCANEDIDNFFETYIEAGVFDAAFVADCRAEAAEIRDVQFTLYALYEGDTADVPVVQNAEMIVMRMQDGAYYLFA